MTVDSFPSSPFRRGNERRREEDTGYPTQRQRTRRRLSVSWIPLFRNIDEDVVNEALVDCEVLSLPAGTRLLKRGERNHNVYISLSGKIAAYLDPNLSEESAIPIASGDCIGELSVIDGKPASVSVLALSEVRVLRLSGEMFWTRLATLPGVARNLMTTLSERMRGATERSLKAQREQLELAHLKKELDAARQLQASMLPLQRPLFPGRSDVDVCGFMEPASSVGGDFFDAFFVSERHLFICIGDVSGHGISSAMFMARVIGLMRVLAMGTSAPDKLLEALNERICIGNETNLFVTLFCAFVDVETGRVTYSNGGHCPPILATGKSANFLPTPKGALIGALSGLHYSSMEHLLLPGDVLFCYTDGITEAQDSVCEEFSEERCLGMLAELRASTPSLPTLLDQVRKAVADFTGSVVLADDCTMLAVRLPT